MFKFKKYREGYEDGKHGVSLKYSLDIGSFLRGEGQDPSEGSATYAAGVEASQNPPSRDAAPLTSGLLPTALDTKQVADISSVGVGVGETSPNVLSSDAVPLVMGLQPVVHDAKQATRAAIEKATLPASTHGLSVMTK